MQNLIPLIHEIHDILDKSDLGHEIRLPQVVVVGSQSTGKSSVLESIIGKEFLPRGKGIVTRRPIEIQLTNVKHKEGQNDWCEFFDKKGQKIFDFDEVRNLIQEETDKLCGQNKNISDQPIRLKIFAEDVVDLLLVDLPGMTKNPVGDQPKDIEQQIMALIEPYVKNPNSIILAISRGSDDLANSESLKLARQVDPQGQRTVGVITQLDIMDQGTDAFNDLTGNTYPLQLGYVGVVMRGAKDMQSKTIKDQLKSEQEFFHNHEHYKKISDKMGIGYLVKSLNVHFMNHIKKCLPFIRDNIVKMIQIRENDLKQYGEYDSLEEKNAKGLYILNMISKFANAYKDLVDGKYLRSNHDQLLGGSRINHIFQEIFRKSLNDINPFDILSDDEIRTAIKNANGLRPSLFVPEGAFENLIKQQISRLLDPTLQCSKLVYEEQRRILGMISIGEIQRFDNFQNRIHEVMEQVLSRCLVPTEQMIKNLIEIELGYINTSHPDFCDGIGMLQNTSQDILKQKNEESGNISQNPSDVDKKQGKQQQKQQQQKKKPHEMEDHNNSYQNNMGDDNQGFWSWFTSSNKQNKETELMDSKLKKMTFNRKLSTEENKQQQQYPELMHTKAYNEDFSINNLNQFMPKQHLPSVPSQIILEESFTKKELTETKMIKNLIVSYFNVVKKNINDYVPKTIITFLTNRSVNICERELVSSLYKEDQFEELLQENEYVVQQRQELKKSLNQLKQCLNVLNDTESKI